MNARAEIRVPLVLRAEVVRRVEVDHVALRVMAVTRADQWFPFVRLAELRCHGPVPLAADVVPACLAAGVRVHWFGRSGAWYGFAVPFRDTAHDDLEWQLRELASQPEWSTRLGTYVRAGERRAMLKMLSAVGLRVSRLDPAVVRPLAERQVLARTELGQAFLEELRAQIRARLAEAWVEHGLPPGALGLFPPGQSPIEGLARIADWHLLTQLWPLRWNLDRIIRNPVHRLSFIERHLPDARRLASAWVQGFRFWLGAEAAHAFHSTPTKPPRP
jgi:hypothetical protein